MARAPVGSGRVSGGRRLRPAPWPPGWALSANTSREREASGGSSDAPAGLGKSVVGGGSINVATGTGSLSDPAPAPPLREGCSEDAFRANASCLLYRGANKQRHQWQNWIQTHFWLFSRRILFPSEEALWNSSSGV